MPAEDGLGLDDNQARPSASPRVGKPDPEDPVSPTKPRALHRAPEDGYLLAEGRVLCRDLGAALEDLSEKDAENLQNASP